jgi:hypothetical protein
MKVFDDETVRFPGQFLGGEQQFLGGEQQLGCSFPSQPSSAICPPRDPPKNYDCSDLQRGGSYGDCRHGPAREHTKQTAACEPR